MRVLVMGGTEFISLHLVRELLSRGPRGHRLQPRQARRSACPRACTTIAGDRKDHAGLRERLGGQPLRRRLRHHLRADARRGRGRAPGRARGPAARRLRLHGRESTTTPCPSPTPRRHAAELYWGDYARHKIAAEDVLLERYRRAAGAGHHRPPDPRHGPAQHPQQRNVLHGPDSPRPARAGAGPRRLAPPVRPRRGPGRRDGRHARQPAGPTARPTT